jgi:hypothetical protein
MADTKISALPASTTPLAGTEVLPIVQSSTTKQVSVANLTVGRAISATQLTLTTGNLIVANNQGIDFSATPGTGTSELLADYEEGTWTPSLTASTSGTITLSSPTNSMTYTKVGRQVTVNGNVNVSSVSSPVGDLRMTGLPFVQSSNAACSIFIYGFSLPSATATNVQATIDAGVSSTVLIRGYLAGSQVTTIAANVGSGMGFYFSATYFV